MAYLKRHFGFGVPRKLADAPVEELVLAASGRGHRQLGACTILKAMHVISHLAGRELLFRLPVSDHDVFHLVEEKVYRVIGTMLANGFPVAEFVGGRKNVDSTYTKLLSKAESTSSALYDKLRFRVVTHTREDLIPVLHHLSHHLFPYSYVVPRQSSNNVLDFARWCDGHAHLRGLVPQLQTELTGHVDPGDNRFSASTYRVIHFVVDLPVRVPRHILDLAPSGSEQLGPVIYVLCEFQLLDLATHAANEAGEANHEAYKRRQRRAVCRRLRISTRHRRRAG